MTLIRRIKVCDKIELWNFLQYMSSLLSLTLQNSFKIKLASSEHNLRLCLSTRHNNEL